MQKNQETFGKPKYGLHGKPLPNFFYKSNSDAKLITAAVGGSGTDAKDGD